MCLATGLVSVGCKRKPKQKEKAMEKPATPTEQTEEKGAEVDIFADDGDVSARKASEEALGTTGMKEPGTDVDLKTEKVDAPKVKEPKGEEIEM